MEQLATLVLAQLEARAHHQHVAQRVYDAAFTPIARQTSVMHIQHALPWGVM